MPSANQRLVYVPWTPGLQPAWTVAGVRGALGSHERGQFNSSAMLIQALGRDDRLAAVTQTRLAGLFSRDFSVEAAGGEDSDARAKVIAEELEADWTNMFSEADLMELWQWYLFAGVAIGELQWQRTANRWTPRLKVWDLQFAYADEDAQEYSLQTQQGEVRIPFGGGDGKWIVLGRGSRPWMNGLIRALATPWLVGQFALRDWARYSERHGMPIVKAMVPAIAESEDKDTFMDDMRVLSNETTVQLPTALDDEGKVGFDLELLEATDRSWEGFQGLIHHIQDSYAIALTGNNLTTMIEGGSYAAAREAGSLRNEYAQTDEQELSTELHDQAVTQWATFNFADAEGRVPWPHWDTSPPEDLKLTAETLKLLGDALGALKTGGAQVVDIAELGEKYGVDLIEKEVPDPPPMIPGMQPPPFGGPVLDQDEEDDEEDEDVQLASGDNPNTAPGFIAGQMYADGVSEDGAKRSKRQTGIDLRTVLQVIETSTDYTDLRVRLRQAYADMDPGPFAELMEKALILGELDGQHATLEDL